MITRYFGYHLKRMVMITMLIYYSKIARSQFVSKRRYFINRWIVGVWNKTLHQVLHPRWISINVLTTFFCISGPLRHNRWHSVPRRHFMLDVFICECDIFVHSSQFFIYIIWKIWRHAWWSLAVATIYTSNPVNWRDHLDRIQAVDIFLILSG